MIFMIFFQCFLAQRGKAIRQVFTPALSREITHAYFFLIRCWTRWQSGRFTTTASFEVLLAVASVVSGRQRKIACETEPVIRHATMRHVTTTKNQPVSLTDFSQLNATIFARSEPVIRREPSSTLQPGCKISWLVNLSSSFSSTSTTEASPDVGCSFAGMKYFLKYKPPLQQLGERLTTSARVRHLANLPPSSTGGLRSVVSMVAPHSSSAGQSCSTLTQNEEK